MTFWWIWSKWNYKVLHKLAEFVPVWAYTNHSGKMRRNFYESNFHYEKSMQNKSIITNGLRPLESTVHITSVFKVIYVEVHRMGNWFFFCQCFVLENSPASHLLFGCLFGFTIHPTHMFQAVLKGPFDFRDHIFCLISTQGRRLSVFSLTAVLKNAW